MSRTIPCVLMRAGTSRGPFFLREWLPDGDEARDQALIGAIGASDPLQLDGVGGGSTLNSKVAIVSRSTQPGCDLDYLFAQVGVGHRSVDTRPNCGNMLSGVAPFAIEQGLIPAQDGTTRVRVYNVNTGSRIDVTVRTPGGRVTYEGDARIDGVAGTAAPILLNFLDAWGAVTGQGLSDGQAHRHDRRRRGDLHRCGDAADDRARARPRRDRPRKAGGARREPGAAGAARSAAPEGRAHDGPGRRVEQRHSEAGAGQRGRLARQHHLALLHAAPMPCLACGDRRDRRGQRVRAARTVASGAAREPGRHGLVVLHPAGQIDVEVELEGRGDERDSDSAALVRTARKIMQGELHLPDYVFSRPEADAHEPATSRTSR